MPNLPKHDQLATGRKLRILTVFDTFSRFAPVINPTFSHRGEDVVATLDRVNEGLQDMMHHKAPKMTDATDWYNSPLRTAKPC